MEADTSDLKQELTKGVQEVVVSQQQQGITLSEDDRQRAVLLATRLAMPKSDQFDTEDPWQPVNVGQNDGFFPVLDAMAADVVAKIGGGANVIVVPDAFSMQHENIALFVKAVKLQRTNYARMIRNDASRFGNVDTTRLIQIMGDMTTPVLLIKEKAVKSMDLFAWGTLIHELGHKLSANETGAVFAHEVGMLIVARGDKDTKTWLYATNKLNVERWRYIARTATDTGIDELIALLKGVLEEADMLEFLKIRAEK